MARIERVTYQELMPTGNYLNSRIGVDLLLNEGEDAKEALKTAKQLVHEFHKESFPQMYEQENIQQVRQGEQEGETKQTQEQKIIEQIMTCTDITILSSYKLIAKSNPAIQIAYDNKLKQLNNDSN